MQPSRSALTLRFLAVDVVGAVVYFPVWWYTVGALKALRWCWGRLSGAATAFGFGIWIRNLFTPMYGQRDIAGRLISFFMRLVTIVFYALILAVLAVLLAVLAVLWLVIPAFIVWQIAVQVRAVAPPAL